MDYTAGPIREIPPRRFKDRRQNGWWLRMEVLDSGEEILVSLFSTNPLDYVRLNQQALSTRPPVTGKTPVADLPYTARISLKDIDVNAETCRRNVWG